ncbi:hypothetical protein ACLOJK_026698 [Asimina triloba]
MICFIFSFGGKVTDAPEIYSNGFHVKFDASEGQIGFVMPTLGRYLVKEIQLIREIGTLALFFPSERNLKKGLCIKLRNMFNNSLVVMRRESIGDGIIKVSHGKEKMSWLVASQKLQASTIRLDVQSTEIAIAFTLQESSDGEYRPHLEQQPVFAFLPSRTYGLKFILQGDFVLPSSREEVEGDSAWKQWLLSEKKNTKEREKKREEGEEERGRGKDEEEEKEKEEEEEEDLVSSLLYLLMQKNHFVPSPASRKALEGLVIRGWDEQGRSLLPESLLHQHLGLGYLHKDIILSDPLAKALGVQEYGPKILTDIISSIRSRHNVYPLRQHTKNPEADSDVIKDLNKISFIPLSGGSYGSLIEGPIWLPCDAFGSGLEGEQIPKDFPNLYAKLRTVNPVLLSVDNANTYSMEDAKVNTLVRMLHKIGVQRLSPHVVIKNHILPAIANNTFMIDDKYLMAETCPLQCSTSSLLVEVVILKGWN